MRRRFYESTPEINLTPLIDVVFVILIMFIVVVPMLEVESVHLANAPEVTMPSLQTTGITIAIDSKNMIFLNQKKMESIHQFKEQLTALKGSKEKPLLFQDQNSFFGTYQAVKNALTEVGFEQVDVILQPKS